MPEKKTPDSRRKISFYLQNDEPTADFILSECEHINLKSRSELYRTCLTSGMILRKIDEKLPNLVAASYSNDFDASVLRALLKAVAPKDEMYFGIELQKMGEHVFAVTPEVWQKRVKDNLSPDSTWSSWIAISQDEYETISRQPTPDIQLRILWGKTESKNASGSKCESIPVLKEKTEDTDPTPELAKPQEETASISNAKKMF